MSKSFREAFGSVNIRDDIMHFFEDVRVERVVLKKQERQAKVCISYDKLITRDHILELERELDDKVFAERGLRTHIAEDYRLTEQYSDEYLIEHYFDSLLMELKDRDWLMYTALRGRVPHLDENRLVLKLADDFVTHQREAEIIRICDKVFQDRFHRSLYTVIEYEEKKENSHRLESEQRARQRVESILKESEERLSAVAETKQSVGDELLGAVGRTAKAGAGRSKSGMGRGFSKGGRRTAEAAGSLKMGNDPDLIFGRSFEGDAIEIAGLSDEGGSVILRGMVLSCDEVHFKKSGKYLFKYTISDFTDAIRIKFFTDEALADEMRSLIKKGEFVKLKGITQYDTYDKEIMITNVYGVKRIPDFRTKREDLAVRKRVELHCHTKMSDMDACGEAGDLIKCAKRFGHSAMAITDHGNVQGFTFASHALDKGDEMKLLYGLEAYVVDDMRLPVVNDRGQSIDGSFVVFDIETTGFVPGYNRIIEIGAVKVESGKITDRFSEFINPKVPIPLEIEKLTGINDSMVAGAGGIEDILPRFLDFCRDCVLVAHNARFDTSFIHYFAAELGLTYDFTHTDTIDLARILLRKLGKYTLDHLASELKIPPFHHHRAVDDAEATAQIFLKFLDMLRERKIFDLTRLNESSRLSPEKIADLYPYHVTILIKNELGRRNLYRLVSLSHLKYNSRNPKIPKSELIKHREGLILGSACANGELYQALINERSSEEISLIADFYDFLEIQPIGNNEYLIDRAKLPTITSREDLIRVNKRIVELGRLHKKPVCATGDVHYIEPEDALYRNIILSDRKLDKVYNYADSMYFHTTEEMLSEFAYLGSDVAEEVVIDNTNKIADMCDRISPVRPDKCPPVIADSDVTLRRICYDKAHEIYGDPLPKIVEERLERELTSIIGNGFAVMYIIAQKLVWKSVEDGYLVGSRGSVGSSFVATMAGITEVNPLSPHYYCMECHYSDFESEDVLAYAGKAGCDMPDKLCPKCGRPLKKDGFDIPFETFLGFKGDKEPDIDLNFSGEYQSKAHKYTEVIFGAGQTYRAGTIGTLADKTAFGIISKYFREHEINKHAAEVDRMVPNLVGIRRTTGQHPGGIVVLPVGEDIDTFTPVQHPPKDDNTITTHFDYHSIDHNLLKLDILGHDDPTMIRMLQDLTAVDPVGIPLDDPEVMSLFKNTAALKISPEDIGGTRLGALGIPEFGTDFAMQMLIDANPTSFSDLVRIAGLSHGTDVWLGNAKDLILSGTATISTAICTRDDIMTYLIQMGVESSEAFNIMEAVRKGNVAKHKVDEKWEKWQEEMRACHVPDWYIESCAKIKYMFPKAHAAAYVMMAWRIAWFKINYPLAYYCAFFSIRASAFDYELMCMGKPVLEGHMAELKKSIAEKTAKPKDEDTYADCRLVQEMYARGFEFTPIDLYKAKASSFQIVDGKLMPSFASVAGVGPNVAELIEDAAARGEFLSKDDFMQRTKASQSVVDTLDSLGILGNMSTSNQMSLFDML